MGTRAGIHSLTGPANPLALLLPLSTLAIHAAEVTRREPMPAYTDEQLEELDEVQVTGAKSSRKPSEIITWMRRPVGQFTYEGHVDLGGRDNPEDQQPVHGIGDCVPFRPAPAVQCEIKVNWPEVRAENGEQMPGWVSNQNPAMILRGFGLRRVSALPTNMLEAQQ